MVLLCDNCTWTTYIAATVVILSATIYLYVQYVFGYWKRRGIKFLKPSLPFGNYGETITQKLSFSILMKKIYDAMPDEPIIGTFATIRPVLLVCDPEIIRNILIKDFNHFVDRGNYIDEHKDPLSGHLLALEGEKWKNLRVKLTPVFTTGKLKAMFSTLLDCGVPLTKYMDNVADTVGVVEIREIFARYTTNIIASVAFGIDINTIDNPELPFRYYGRKAFELSIKNGLRNFLFFIWPKVMAYINLKSVDNDIEAFILDLVKQNIELREKNNVSRKDLFQLLIQLRNTGKVEADGIWDANYSTKTIKQLTINEMAAQAWIFYIAGFETSSTTTSFCLYELAKNPTIQQNVQLEIDEIVEKFNGKISYESISAMKYLEACIDETLRMYPALPILNRVCNKDYTIPGLGSKIEKGTAIIIPTYAIHMDEKYYPNPDTFDPDRFLSENKAEKGFTDMPYLPFGDGPRNCIGFRLGKMQTKAGLVQLLQKYSFDLVSRDKLVISPKALLLAPIGGINLKVTKRW